MWGLEGQANEQRFTAAPTTNGPSISMPLMKANGQHETIQPRTWRTDFNTIRRTRSDHALVPPKSTHGQLAGNARNSPRFLSRPYSYGAAPTDLHCHEAKSHSCPLIQSSVCNLVARKKHYMCLMLMLLLMLSLSRQTGGGHGSQTSQCGLRQDI